VAGPAVRRLLERSARGRLDERRHGHPYACGPGFAFLDTGQINRARRVYDFLKAIYGAQTELPTRFYYAWSRAEQKAITEFDEEQRFGRLVDNRAALRQRWTIGGISAGFLCRLYMADPNPDYLELARKYQDFSMASTDRQFDYPQVCKSSWGSSLLYQLTGEERYESGRTGWATGTSRRSRTTGAGGGTRTERSGARSS
jgi:hypothetical protein